MKSIILLSIFIASVYGYGHDEASIGIGGRISKEEKITGGEVVVPNSIPYMVSLFIEKPNSTSYCGGSLISPNYVLTAGHCVRNGISVLVQLGDHDRFEYEPPNEIQMTSTEFAAHELQTATRRYDIAWVKLPTSVEYTDAIQPVRLPSRSDNGIYAGLVGTMSGWGRTSGDDPDTSALLRSTKATVIPWTKCAKFYEQGLVSSTHVCTDSSTGHGACRGDSGGPFVIDGVQVGVMSFGAPGRCDSYPSVFTKVRTYLDWIAEHTDAIISD